MMIKPVSYATILDDPNAEALLAEYAAECSLPELGTPSPQRELYELLEKSGGFQAFGFYDGETLVGFCCVLIYVLPHYGTKVATTESIFIQPSHRKAGAGYELMMFVEAHAKQNGCTAFLYSAPINSQFDKILSVRYRHTNNVYLSKL